MMGFASAYSKSNFESNFWISQTFCDSPKTANVRIWPNKEKNDKFKRQTKPQRT